METQKKGKTSGEFHYSAEEIMAARSLAANWTEQEVMTFIAECYDRDILLKTLLGYASNWLSMRLITVVTKDGLQPFLLEDVSDSLDLEHDPQRLRTIRAPYQPTAPPTNQTLAGTSTTDKAQLHTTPFESSGLQPLFEQLELPAPQSLAVLPIQFATKTILLLIGNPELSDTTPSERDIASLYALTTATGNQLGEIIGRAKSATLPPVDERVPALPHPLSVPKTAATVVEELTASLIAEPEPAPFTIDDGWLALLEDPTPIENQLKQPETQIPTPEQPDEQPVPILPNQPEDDSQTVAHTLELYPDALLDLSATNKTVTRGFETLSDELSESELAPISAQPILNKQSDVDDDDRPTHTLELYPDALLDLNTTSKTITHGFETLSDDLSDSVSEPELAPEPEPVEPEPVEPEQNDNEKHDEQNRPTHTLELFVTDKQLAEATAEQSPNKTLSGGFEAVKREPHPTPEPAVPNAGVVKRVSPSSQLFKRLKEKDLQEPETQIPELQKHESKAPNAPISPPPKSTSQPDFDLDSYQKAFPGQLLVDRYQHTIHTMPPAQEHGPLLAELVDIGTPALDVVRAHINSTSIELRFYALLLLHEMPAHTLLEDVVERLFDRDQQIRALAQKIVLDARLDTSFERVVVQRMRNEIISNLEDIRVEVAAEIIGAIQDSVSIPLLIEALGQHHARIQLVLQDALMGLTFQDLAPSISEWRRWWQTAQHQPRTTWLVDALNSPSETVRHAALKQTQQIPGLNLNYHPNQPEKLRTRAQQDLIHWFENF